MLRLASFIVLAALGAQQPSFRAGVEVVTVPVTVTSLDRNTYIAGLTPADFKVSENGERQDITVVTRERVPVSVVFAVDSSPIMAIGIRRSWPPRPSDKVVAALQPDDEVSILFIRKTIEERLPWTRVGQIKELNWGGWNPSAPAGGINAGVAPLNDGMRAALDQIERANNPRRAVLIVSAGFESSSRMSIASLVKTRQQSETTVFGIGLGSADPRLVAAEPHVMKPSGGVRANIRQRSRSRCRRARRPAAADAAGVRLSRNARRRFRRHGDARA